MQTELPIESQDEAEQALVEKLRGIYIRYGSLGNFFRENGKKLQSSDKDNGVRIESVASRKAGSRFGKA